MVSVLLSMLASNAPCAVEMITRFVDGPAFDRSAVRDELEHELHRPVTYEQTSTCDQVTFSIDTGVITVSVQARDKAMVRRVLERGPDEVHQSVLLASNVLRDLLGDHLTDAKALAVQQPQAPPVPEPPLTRVPTSAVWAEVDATFALTYRGISSAGVDVNAAWQHGWLRAGLSFAHTSALLFNELSTRFSLVPEVGFYGGLGRFRIGLQIGIGPLILRDNSVATTGYFVIPEYRARLFLGAALSDDFELVLNMGYAHAPSEEAQLGLLFCNVGIRYRFAQL